MDVFSPAKRSEIMRRVRSKDTKPEIFIRRLVSDMGFRYRLNSDLLPGHPDLVFSRLRKWSSFTGASGMVILAKPAHFPSVERLYWEGRGL